MAFLYSGRDADTTAAVDDVMAMQLLTTRPIYFSLFLREQKESYGFVCDVHVFTSTSADM